VQTLLRILVNPLSIAVWPLLLGGVGYIWGYYIAGHPHAWQAIPILGALIGGALTLLHGAVLLVLWFKYARRAAQQGAPGDGPRPAGSARA